MFQVECYSRAIPNTKPTFGLAYDVSRSFHDVTFVGYDLLFHGRDVDVVSLGCLLLLGVAA